MVLLLRGLEGALAGLFIVVHVAFLASVPLGDPWGRDLRGVGGEAAVGGGLLFFLAFVAAELGDEVVEEGHGGGIGVVVCG